MKKGKETVFQIFNCIIPLFIGAMIYYILSPEVIFVRHIDNIVGENLHIDIVYSDLSILRFIRNYVLDMMWAYALVFALHFFIGNRTEKLFLTVIIAVIFSALMEILQLTSIAMGTFDVLDILVEVLAEIAAVLFIKKFYSKEERA